MSISEGQRHELHEGLVEAIGRERADSLMSMLPPVGWAEVATKQDLTGLEQRMNLRFDLMEQKFLVTLHQELHAVTWRTIGGTWGSVVTAVVLHAVLT
jgi:hypothetical protein